MVSGHPFLKSPINKMFLNGILSDPPIYKVLRGASFQTMVK